MRTGTCFGCTPRIEKSQFCLEASVLSRNVMYSVYFRQNVGQTRQTDARSTSATYGVSAVNYSEGKNYK